MQAAVKTLSPSLPNPAVDRNCCLIIPFCPKQISFLERHEHVARIALNQATGNGQRFWVTMFSPQKQNQQNLRVRAGVARSRSTLAKFLQSQLLVAAKSKHCRSRAQRQWKTAHHI